MADANTDHDLKDQVPTSSTECNGPASTITFDSIDEPYLGPIIGHTTSDSVNIWLAGQYAASDQDRSDVAFAICDSKIHFQVCNRLTNMSTVLHIPDLRGSHCYTCQVAMITNVRINGKSAKGKQINQISNYFIQYAQDNNIKYVETVFTTFPYKHTQSNIHFILTSCQYPKPREKSDLIFKAIYDHLDAFDDLAGIFIIGCGDQIYGDQYNKNIPLCRADTNKEFRALYEKKYQGKYFRKLAQCYPHYFTWDDHDVARDNWSMDQMTKHCLTNLTCNPFDAFMAAVTNYKLYQLAFGPNWYDIDHRPLYYNFNCANYPFFVLDTRAYRIKGKKLMDNHLLDIPNEVTVAQMEELCAWLCKQPDEVPKFIVSSVIFAPFFKEDIKNPMDSDNWVAFPQSRQQLLSCIVENNIQKVIFLSGDIHCSMAVDIFLRPKVSTISQLLGDVRDQIRLTQIISSPLYWPWPFATGRPADFILETNRTNRFKFKADHDDWVMEYRVADKTFTQGNNFAAITADYDSMHVEWKNVHNEIIVQTDIKL